MTGSFPSLREAARALKGDVVNRQISCPGPGHSAGDRSLSVKPTPDAPSGYVVNSFAGDDPITCRDYVADKLGLGRREAPETASDIIGRMNERARQSKPNGNGEAASDKPKLVATYVYRTADGEPYGQVLRYEPKSYRQQHWTGANWTWGKHKGPKVPYRLPELLEAVGDEVFVVEGEKDADALAALGFVATTASEGAGKWTPDLNEWFKGRTVHILADNDKAGRDHAYQVAGNLHGAAAEVRVVELPGLPEKGDVSDWLAAGGGPATLPDLCRRAPVDRPSGKLNGKIGGKIAGQIAPVIRTAAELRRKVFAPIKWIVPDYLAEGCTLLAGRPKLGKSWLALDIGLAVAAGRYVLGDKLCERGDVLALCLEDNERRLQRRITKVLGAFGAEWPERFTYATEWPRANEGGLDAIRAWLEAAENPRLVIVDVLAMFKPVRGDKESLYEAEYNSLRGLTELAGEFGVAILVITHVRKAASESGDVVEKINSTLGLSGAADAFLVLDRDGQGCTLSGRGRDVEETEVAVAFDKEACRWNVQGIAAEVRRTDERSVILNALKEADDLMAPGDLADATRMPSANVRQLLVSMVKAGEVTKVSRGRYAHPDRTDLHAADHKRKTDSQRSQDHKLRCLPARSR
jgi:hypothetical protein